MCDPLKNLMNRIQRSTVCRDVITHQVGVGNHARWNLRDDHRPKDGPFQLRGSRTNRQSAHPRIKHPDPGNLLRGDVKADLPSALSRVIPVDVIRRLDRVPRHAVSEVVLGSCTYSSSEDANRRGGAEGLGGGSDRGSVRVLLADRWKIG